MSLSSYIEKSSIVKKNPQNHSVSDSVFLFLKISFGWIESNWISLDPFGLDREGAGWIGIDQAGSNWIWLDQAGSAWIRLDLAGSGWIGLG